MINHFITRDEILSRARLWSRVMSPFVGSLTQDNTDSEVAKTWLQGFMVGDRLEKAAEKWLGASSGVHGYERGLLVTPGTGYTSGIQELFWLSLVCDSPYTIWSSRDVWTQEIVRRLWEEDKRFSGESSEWSKQNPELLPMRLQDYDALVVNGGQETVDLYTDSWGSDPSLIVYGPKRSVGIHVGDFDDLDLEKYFYDMTLYNGLGCLNTSTLYVPEMTREVEDFLRTLEKKTREHFKDSGSGFRVHSWISEHLFDCEGPIGKTYLHRKAVTPHLYPVGYGTLEIVEYDNQDSLREDLMRMADVNSSVTLNYQSSELVRLVIESGFTRITDPGSAQWPSLEWAHDGHHPLFSLATPVTIEDSAERMLQ